MDKAHHLRLLSGFLQDYSNGRVELGVMINNIEAIFGIVNDPALADEVFGLGKGHRNPATGRAESFTRG